METQLTGSHQTTYDAIFQHPIARNLAWRDLRAMLEAIPGMAHEEHNGMLTVSRNGRTFVLQQPIRKTFDDVHALRGLRRFLEQSEAVEPS